jgi:phage I-like protein
MSFRNRQSAAAHTAGGGRKPPQTLALAAFAQPGEPPTEMLVLPAGVLMPIDGRGPWIVDADSIDRIMAAYEARLANGIEPPLDFNHGSVAEYGPDGVAAGWIKSLTVRADGIWASVEYTQAGLDALATGGFRYLSPGMMMEWVYPPNAPAYARVVEINHVALVNVPALDLVVPFAAAAAGTAKARAAFDGSVAAIEAYCTARGRRLDQVLAAAMPTLPTYVCAGFAGQSPTGNAPAPAQPVHPAPATPAPENAAVDKKKLAEMAAAAGYTPPDGMELTEAGLRGHLEGLKAAAAANSDVKARLDQVEADARKDRVESMFAKALNEGRVTPAQVETFRPKALASREGLEFVASFINSVNPGTYPTAANAAAQPKVPMVAGAPGAVLDAELAAIVRTPEAQQIFAQMGIDDAMLAKYGPKPKAT